MKLLSSIKLPVNPDICLFAISASQYGVVKDCELSVVYQEMRLSGRTPWLLLLNSKDEKKSYKVLARFQNGYPAIIQSRDDKHIAFLYDALNPQVGNEEDFSRQLDVQAEILKDILGDF